VTRADLLGGSLVDVEHLVELLISVTLGGVGFLLEELAHEVDLHQLSDGVLVLVKGNLSKRQESGGVVLDGVGEALLGHLLDQVDQEVSDLSGLSDLVQEQDVVLASGGFSSLDGLQVGGDLLLGSGDVLFVLLDFLLLRLDELLDGGALLLLVIDGLLGLGDDLQEVGLFNLLPSVDEDLKVVLFVTKDIVQKLQDRLNGGTLLHKDGNIGLQGVHEGHVGFSGSSDGQESEQSNNVEFHCVFCW